jgi:HEAT repeat protein
MPSSNDDSEITHLIALVMGEDVPWPRREAAVRQLAAIGGPAVAPMIATLEQDPSAWGVPLLVRALGQAGDRRAIDPLLTVLQQTNPHVRQEAAKALGHIGDTRTIAPLIEAFRIESDDIEDVTAWQDAAEALAQFGNQALEPLLAAPSR